MNMGDNVLINGLNNKKQEMLQQVAEYKSLIDRLLHGVASIDSAIKYLSGDIEITNISGDKRARTVYFKPNECKVMVLDFLRESKVEYTTKQIAEHLAERIGFNKPDDFKNMQISVAKTLDLLAKKELINKVGNIGSMTIWKIA